MEIGINLCIRMQVSETLKLSINLFFYANRLTTIEKSILLTKSSPLQSLLRSINIILSVMDFL